MSRLRGRSGAAGARGYAHVEEAAFRAGRRRVLAGFLERPRIDVTPVFHDALEARARENLQRGIAEAS